MTVEPYAFYFMGRDSSVSFTGLTAEPKTLTSVGSTNSNNYYYYSKIIFVCGFCSCRKYKGEIFYAS